MEVQMFMIQLCTTTKIGMENIEYISLQSYKG